MRKTVLAVSIAIIACTPLIGHAQQADTTASEITVEAKLGTGIQDMEPVGVAVTFPADVDTVYLWTKVLGAKDTTFVKHVWTYNGKEVASVELPVKSSSWRTWSSKAIMPEWTGQWQVRVLDANGDVLRAIDFTIEPAQQMAAPKDTTSMKDTTAMKETPGSKQ